MEKFAPAPGWSWKAWTERFRCSVYPAERLAKLSFFFVGVLLPVCGLVAFISDSQFSCARSAVSVTNTHILKCASSSSIVSKGR